MTAALPEGVVLRRGLPARLRPEAARIYWQAFGGKLGAVMGPEARALNFLERAIRGDHAIIALDAEGNLLGLAGFKTAKGSLAGGSAADLNACYGRIGGAWRAAVMRLLQSEPDNSRFLIDGICVRQGMRGRGLGRHLIEALCLEARARGYDDIRLDVIDTNWRARALYEREGFVVVRSERIGWLRYVFGFAATTTMVKSLR